MELSEFVRTIAKAVAAFVTPLIVTFVAGLAERAGVEVPVDPSWVESLVVSVITAFAVWATRNRQPAGAGS